MGYPHAGLYPGEKKGKRSWKGPRTTISKREFTLGGKNRQRRTDSLKDESGRGKKKNAPLFPLHRSCLVGKELGESGHRPHIDGERENVIPVIRTLRKRKKKSSPSSQFKKGMFHRKKRSRMPYRQGEREGSRPQSYSGWRGALIFVPGKESKKKRSVHL